MSTDTKPQQRPFGIEYLEAMKMPVRGSQTMTGDPDGCCNTYNSAYVNEELGDMQDGGAFCDDIDVCVQD